MKGLFTAFLLVWVSCHAEEPKLAEVDHPVPATFESLRAWHARGGLGHYPWPKEHQVDLDGDGKNEVFLGVSGFGRGMIYALFTQKHGKWIVLSKEIEGSHHPFQRLKARQNGWSDFQSLQPDGRGGLTETIYAWDGKGYASKSSREIHADQLSETPPSDGKTSK